MMGGHLEIASGASVTLGDVYLLDVRDRNFSFQVTSEVPSSAEGSRLLLICPHSPSRTLRLSFRQH